MHRIKHYKCSENYMQQFIFNIFTSLLYFIIFLRLLCFYWCDIEDILSHFLIQAYFSVPSTINILSDCMHLLFSLHFLCANVNSTNTLMHFCHVQLSCCVMSLLPHQHCLFWSDLHWNGHVTMEECPHPHTHMTSLLE